MPLVVDFDDAWHLRYSASVNPLVRWALGTKLERIAKRADFVIVANRYLQSWAKEAGARNVSCIPTVVDLRRYPEGSLPPPKPFTIGWIGTPETAPYLDTIKGALTRVLAKEDTRLLLVGAEQSFLPLHNVESQPWSEARETNLLSRMHVGIMPLPQGAWEYGKSGYKLVQYMAARRPVVASPVGVNCDVVMEGVNGFFARTEDEWVERLEQFRGNLALTSQLGSAARGTVESSFSLHGDGAEDRRDLAVGGCAERATAVDAGQDAPQIRSGALRRVKRRRTIPINSTSSAPTVAAPSCTEWALAGSR